jgi:Uma2 family endonuclease
MATISVRIGPSDHGRAITPEEFEEAEEEPGYRYELARGVLEVTQVPDEPHALYVCYLYDAIARYRLAHAGAIFLYGGGSEYRLWLPEMISGRHPDVALTLRNTPKGYRGSRPPALVFEIVSEGAEAHTRDYVAKREEYLRFGIREYWIVDPQARTILVLLRDGDAWVERAYSNHQTAEGLVLPGFVVPLADLWAAAQDGGDDPS